MPDIQSRCLHGSVAHTAAVCCTLSACGENVQPSLGGAALQHAAAATACLDHRCGGNACFDGAETLGTARYRRSVALHYGGTAPSPLQ